MPFSAINTYEQEIKQRNERHTLELQLEQAMQVYQTALELQRVNKIKDAEEHYMRLFAFDVLKPRKITDKYDTESISSSEQLSPSNANDISAKSLQFGPAIRLRAMALKNFALLLLSSEDVTTDDANKALQFLGEALDLVGTEDKEKLVLPSLVSVLWALGMENLARLGLEILVQNKTGSALVPLEEWVKSKSTAETLFGPRTIESLKALEYVSSEKRTADTEPPKMLRKYKNLSQLVSTQPILSSYLESEGKVEISLTSKSWESLTSAIDAVVSSSSRRGKRKQIRDGYAWSHNDLYIVGFLGSTFKRHKSEEGKPNESFPSVIATKTDNVSRQVSESAPGTPQMHKEGFSSPLVTPIGTPVGTPVSTPQQLPATDIMKPESAEKTSDSVDTREVDQVDVASVVASPIKRRRYDRVKRSSLALPADFGMLDSIFINQFNSYLALVDRGSIPLFYSPADLFLDPNQDIREELVGSARLRNILSGWDSHESTQLLMEAASTKPQKGGIMDTLRKGNINDFGSQNPEDEDLDLQTDDIILESAAVEQFITQHSNMHIQQIRWSLSRVLMNKLLSGNQLKSFGQTVYKFIEGVENLLWSRRQFLSDLELVIIFSLYADHWMQTKNTDTEIRLSRWKNATITCPGLPHSWISAFVNQESESASPASSVVQFEGILEQIENICDEQLMQYYESLFSYLKEIPPLTVANLQIQISKFKAAASFDRALTPSDTSNAIKDNKESNSSDDIKLLEAMLMPWKCTKPDSTSEAEFEAIQNFLGYAQPQFKMGLWYVLLEKYEASGSVVDSLIGLTQIFTEAIGSLDKGEPLLQIFSVAHDVGKRLVPLLERNPNLLKEHYSNDEALNLMRPTIKLIQILHLFVLYDDALTSNLLQKPITPSWPQALQKLRELVVMWWCIFYRFWLRCIPESASSSPETVNDFLSIIHERLGNLGYCGIANSCLLNLHFSEIARINWEGSSLDMTQCLKCKFGLTMSLYGDVANHHTVPTKLEKKEATVLLPYVMQMVLNHRNFQQAVMRMDTRAVIEEFSVAYGNRRNDKKHKKHVEWILDYLSSDFTPKLLRNAWFGRDDSKITYDSDDDAQGIWLVQAGIIMNQYKIRRRQTYSATSVKTESLDSAIDLYIDDLAAKPTRLESWVGLVQGFLFKCEDCLTFGDETTIENVPEVYCRKALLAAIRAISILTNEKRPFSLHCISVAQKDLYENGKSAIWTLFGYALILSTMPPLERKPFAATTRPIQPLLVELPSNQSLRIGLKKPIELHESVALRVALTCLSKYPDPQAKWISYMHMMLAAFQLDLGPEEVLKYARMAKEFSPNGIYDPDIEIINIVWHYYREKRINDTDVQTILLDLSLGGTGSESDNVQNFVESKLRWLTNKDKWLHRPRYLLAKIYELDNHDSIAAQQELMQLFSLKSPTKPLVIWKTDSDLPGQHGVYMTRYICYMADLMYTNKDSGGLLLMVRRFRKTGAEMWNHSGTHEYIYGQCCSLVRDLLPIEACELSRYKESLMTELTDDFEKFDSTLKSMTSSVENDLTKNDKWILALFYIIELRRLHSGPSTISQADELMIVVFLTIMKKFSIAHPLEKKSADGDGTSSGNQPNGNEIITSTENSTNKNVKVDGHHTVSNKKLEKQAPRKKVLRKDIIHSAQMYIKPVQQMLAKIDEIHMPKELGSAFSLS